MKKYFIPILILFLVFFCKALFADRYDQANEYYLEAYNLYKIGKVDESMELLKKVIELDPDHAEAHFGMGSIHFRQNRYDDAAREFTRVTHIKPEYAQAYERLWLAYKKLGMNDKAEESLQNYRKIISERMQAMTGESPRIVRPVTPPPQQEKSGMTGSQPPGTRGETPQPSVKESSGKTTPETKLAEARSPETEEEEKENSISSVKPVSPQVKESAEPSEKGAKTSILATGPPGTEEPVKPVKPSRQSSTIPLNPSPDKKYKDSQATVTQSNAKYQTVFKPFKMIGAILFKNPLRKNADKYAESFKDKLLKWFIYYIATVQVWLCVVTSLFIYFRKIIHKKRLSQEEFQSIQKGK